MSVVNQAARAAFDPTHLSGEIAIELGYLSEADLLTYLLLVPS
jgi:hypothetical protein